VADNGCRVIGLRRALAASIGVTMLALASGVGAQSDEAPAPTEAPDSPPSPAPPSPAPPSSAPPPSVAPAETTPPTQAPGYGQPPPPGYGYPPPLYPVPYYFPVQEPPAWSPGEPAPPGYRVETRPDVKTIRSGVGLLVGFWIVSVITGAALNEAEQPKEEDGDDVEPGDWSVLYWPVAGPFLAMRHTSTEDAGWGLLLLDGVLQSVGVIAIGIGLASREQKLVRDSASAALELRVAPTLHRTGAGVGLLGRF
jgi:hypothetical protein